MFHVPISNAKNIKIHVFDPHATEIKYVQYDNNHCWLSILDSDFFAENKHVAEHAVVSRLSSSLSCDSVGFRIRIRFSSDILTDRVRNKR